MRIPAVDFVDPHLNVYWLRPESALWDAIASSVVSQFDFASPSLDLGSGNGIFSFITAGGTFSHSYDWYRNVDPRGFWENKDIYDTVDRPPEQSSIVRRPRYQIDVAFDAKLSLLAQAAPLGLYKGTKQGDANDRWPFEESSFTTVFSNILYWLRSPEHSLQELRRILRPGGRAILCVQDHRFKEFCFTYRWRETGSELKRLLNRGRAESSYWTTSYDEFSKLAEKSGLGVAAHQYYLSPLTLRMWDVGLRPLSPVLIRMTQMLTEDQRSSIKEEWMDTCRGFLRELVNLDDRDEQQGGYHLFCLENA